MLYWYLTSIKDNHLARLMWKTDQQFWRWVHLHYKRPTEETAYQIVRWRRICTMIYDEMYSLDRFERNR